MMTNKLKLSRLKGSTLTAALSLALIGGLGSLWPADTASAARCDISSICADTARQQGSQTRSRISTMERNISDAIRVSTDRIIGALREQTAALTTSGTQNTKAASDNVQSVQQASDALKARTSHVAPDCSGTAAASGGRSGGARDAREGGGSDSSRGSNLSQPTTQAVQEGVTQEKLPPSNAGYAQARTGVGGCMDFSDPNSALGQLCEATGAPKNGRSPYPNADVSAKTLFEGPDSLINNKSILSVPSTGPEADARMANLNLLFEGSPVEMPRDDILKEPVLSGPFLGKYREYRANKDMSKWPSELWNRLTTIVKSTKEALEIVKVQDKAFYDKFFEGVDPKYHAEGVSPMTLMEFMVESRIGNPDWIERMAEAPVEKKTTEIMMMKALELRIQQQALVAQLQTNVLLGKLLDIEVEQRMRPEMEEMTEEMSARKATIQSQLNQ